MRQEVRMTNRKNTGSCCRCQTTTREEEEEDRQRRGRWERRRRETRRTFRCCFITERHRNFLVEKIWNFWKLLYKISCDHNHYKSSATVHHGNKFASHTWSRLSSLTASQNHQDIVFWLSVSYLLWLWISCVQTSAEPFTRLLILCQIYHQVPFCQQWNDSSSNSNSASIIHISHC